MPDLERKICPSPTLPITIVCDNVREPGNLGAILRIAAAIPVERVMTLNGRHIFRKDTKCYIYDKTY